MKKRISIYYKIPQEFRINDELRLFDHSPEVVFQSRFMDECVGSIRSI